MDFRDWFGPALAFVGTALGASIAFGSNFGRRQRLKFAVDLRDKIPADRREAWDQMISSDVDAVTRSALASSWFPSMWFLVLAGLLYLAGLLLGFVFDIVPDRVGLGFYVAAILSSWGLPTYWAIRYFRVRRRPVGSR